MTHRKIPPSQRQESGAGQCHVKVSPAPGTFSELEEIIQLVTESREQTRVSPSAPRHLVVATSGQTPGTGHRLLTTSGELGEYVEMELGELFTLPDTERCVSLRPRHPCVSRPCNLIARAGPHPAIYLDSFS